MKRLLVIAIMGISMLMSANLWSFDATMANSYEALFSTASGAKVGKALHLMSPAMFVNGIIGGKEFVVIDIRTPMESRVFGMELPNSLAIPLDKLFQSKNLATIPTDRPTVVICQSGIRATAAGTALRHVGFDNVYILKGGFKALIAHLGPKEANQ